MYLSKTFRIGRNIRMLLLGMLHTLGRAGIDSTGPWGGMMRVSSSLYSATAGCDIQSNPVGFHLQFDA